jgi:two-component system chemotaxis response regulator CheB
MNPKVLRPLSFDQNGARREQAAPVLRSFSKMPPGCVVIGASTGGPQALAVLLEQLAPGATRVPIFIVLHMPGDFAPVVAGHLGRLTGRPTCLAANGALARPGHIYVAPGNVHLGLVRGTAGAIMKFIDGPPEQFCKPAVDVLFRTAADTYGPATLGLVLSGMGNDGLAGSRAIVNAGGSVLVQDAATSVVWGMPGSVASAGLASAILPLDRLAATVGYLLRGLGARVGA